MFWLITALISVGVGGFSVFATLNRIGGNVERAFHRAPELPVGPFAEAHVAGSLVSPSRPCAITA